MGTITAQILVGEAHPNHGGIYPTHVLYLSEDSKPAWILETHNILVEPVSKQKPIIWIPTLEHMLEDALLMVSCYVAKHPQIYALVQEKKDHAKDSSLQLYQMFEKEELAHLHAINQNISSRLKLIVNVFEGSTIRKQLNILEKYGMEVEVLVPTFSRLFSRWSNQWITTGSLQ